MGPNKYNSSWDVSSGGELYRYETKGDNQRLFPWIKMDPPLTESDNRLDVAAQILDIDARVSFT